MKVCTTFAILAFLSLFAAGAASAGRFNAAGAKEANVPLPPIVHRVKREEPIVMGRSVAAHRKSKLHHIKVNPIDATEKPAEGAR